MEIPESRSDLKKKLGLLTKRGTLRCKIANYPFAHGSVRASFFGKIKGEDGNWMDVVLKEFISKHDRTLKEYANQAENSAVACF